MRAHELDADLQPLGGFLVKRFAMASCVLAFFVAGSSLIPATARVSEQCPLHPLYAARTHAKTMFSGSARIPESAWRVQMRLVGCQSSRANVKRIRGYDHRLHLAHAARRSAALNPFRSGVASYYDDGALGLGTHYGFAACGAGVCVPRGTRIEFCYAGCVVAVRDDSGPFVAGRDFDLNVEAAQAVGMTGAGVVRLRWRLVR